MRWPCTKDQLEEVMAEMKYEYKRDQSKHDFIWQKLLEKFCAGHKPVVREFLDIEKKIGRN